MSDPFDLMAGMGFWAEPPVSVPLRILDMSPDHQPSHDYIKRMFRMKIKAAHPDLQAQVESFSIRDVDELDVQELVWARDVLLRKFPPPPDPSTVAANAQRHASAVIRNRCPVCKDEHAEQFERPKRSRGRWRGYCERCARDAENARRPEIRHFLRSHTEDDSCEHCYYMFVPADRHSPPSESQPVSHRKCAGCGATFTPKRADGRYCSGACRQASYRRRSRDQANR